MTIINAIRKNDYVDFLRMDKTNINNELLIKIHKHIGDSFDSINNHNYGYGLKYDFYDNFIFGDEHTRKLFPPTIINALNNITFLNGMKLSDSFARIFLNKNIIGISFKENDYAGKYKKVIVDTEHKSGYKEIKTILDIHFDIKELLDNINDIEDPRLVAFNTNTMYDEFGIDLIKVKFDRSSVLLANQILTISGIPGSNELFGRSGAMQVCLNLGKSTIDLLKNMGDFKISLLLTYLSSTDR